jgi:hypothetical protein
MVEIVAGWEPDGSNGAAHRQWAQNLQKSLAPFALPGGYPNLLGPDDREQAAAAYLRVCDPAAGGLSLRGYI